MIVTFVKGRAPAKLYKKEYTHWELKTNMQGIAKIPPIPQGTIKVQIIASNYQTFGDFFEVEEAEKTITIQLKDPQSQYSAHGDNDPISLLRASKGEPQAKRPTPQGFAHRAPSRTG